MQAPDLALITDAIRMAGRVATSFTGPAAQSWDKPGGAGPVTEADLAVNTMLESVLRSARPSYGWLSEETEDSAARMSCDTVFIIDPIDGTRSFVEGSRTWAHSVAIAHHGQITAAAVYLPMRDKLYSAALGEGAFHNGERIAVSRAPELNSAQILATKPAVAPDHWPAGLPGFTRSHRPSLAYRLGLVAEAKFDAMLTFRPTWEWDIAAGALIVTEAGGLCTDKTGAPLRFNNANPTLNGVIASGSLLHEQVLAALGPVPPAAP
ncbi:3'(2'),5'-bisphosphate nucleotidase CysQ [Roseobacter sp. YSTF-M11]|uniref:3'(2'),5'-bisphosphate nucleotidase CysQ n=1 Tax=Roseobacter insulae TaxID=2859783 RepID=A0A9X1FS13_9RHOB|nr:3'(2'),5'-bisphosphate nucleotidase CysQ [Roseobacter insulae]MBW4706578.1 3'(2'),5'-bisphosphate nucleotidase CysQ [Roseobacter insulae]